jgi:prohibitin 2
MPGGTAGTSTGIKILLGAGVLLYAGSQSLFNVDGGHAAIVFNRFVGVKQKIYGEGTVSIFLFS